MKVVKGVISRNGCLKETEISESHRADEVFGIEEISLYNLYDM